MIASTGMRHDRGWLAGALFGVALVATAATPCAWGVEPGNRAPAGVDCGKFVPGQAAANAVDACPGKPSPDTGAALARQHRKHLLSFGVNALVGAGVMTAGVLTRNEPGWRALSVTSATLGGTMGGFVIGEVVTQPCSAGALCGLGQAVAGVAGALVGAAAGFGAGMLLSSGRGGGRVAATGLGVGIYLGLAAYASFNDWDRVEPPGRRD